MAPKTNQRLGKSHVGIVSECHNSGCRYIAGQKVFRPADPVRSCPRCYPVVRDIHSIQTMNEDNAEMISDGNPLTNYPVEGISLHFCISRAWFIQNIKLRVTVRILDLINRCGFSGTTKITHVFDQFTNGPVQGLHLGISSDV